MDFDEAIEKYEVVIGLEVHVELNTNTKMFCGCANEFGRSAKHQCLPDMSRAYRGHCLLSTSKAVEYSIAIGLAFELFDCK
jgi:aspartyl-tRNA(Asn)/glutamyl-tRNA(Gln) amidotransferase subunit B